MIDRRIDGIESLCPSHRTSAAARGRSQALPSSDQARRRLTLAAAPLAPTAAVTAERRGSGVL